MLLNVPALPVSNRSVCVCHYPFVFVSFAHLLSPYSVDTDFHPLKLAYWRHQLLALNTRSCVSAIPYLPDMVGQRHKKKEYYGGKMEQNLPKNSMKEVCGKLKTITAAAQGEVP